MLEKFPESIEIGGEKYEINTDYRDCLTIILAYEDEALTEQEKAFIMLTRLYQHEIPAEHLQEAAEKAIWFLNCGEDKKGDSGERLYSFEKDAKYIYSAISQTHGIDLQMTEYMHWWKFCYLFLDIGKDCFFAQLIDLRRRKDAGKLTKEEVEFCNSIIEIIELGEVESGYADEFMRALKGERECNE